MKKINRDMWLPYIKTYEDFNRQIPDELKSLFNKIRQIIGYRDDSFKIDIDLSQLGSYDTILNIDVKYEEVKSNLSYSQKDIVYYSNINIYDIINGETEIEIPIIIKDIKLNNDKLISLISHEVRHIYDVIEINDEKDMKSFENSLYYTKLNKTEDNSDFKYFLFLVYLSLEHELIARNTMIWEMFINSKCSKEELIKEFKTTYIFESFEMLKNFDYNNLLKIDNIQEKVNNFINYFGGEECKNHDDILKFFSGWKKYFSEKSNEYEIESYKVLDNLYQCINEKYEKIKSSLSIKEILLNIHNNYCIKK